jgi:hypothetical protein
MACRSVQHGMTLGHTTTTWVSLIGQNVAEQMVSSPPLRISLSTGSILFELSHSSNAGLQIAINLLQPLKDAFPSISWADLLQLASAAAIEFSGLSSLLSPLSVSLTSAKGVQRFLFAMVELMLAQKR